MEEKILVGLDRDGTINYDSGYFGKDDNWKEQLKIYPGVIEGIKSLNQNPLIKIIVATNQAGVARGYYNCERVREINSYIDEIFKSNKALVDRWYYCPYVGKEYAKEKNLLPENKWIKETDTRKPGIGMLRKSAEEMGLRLEDFAEISFIGDTANDVKTGLNANGNGILILNEENEKEYAKIKDLEKNEEYKGKVFIVKNFQEACKIVLSNTKIKKSKYNITKNE